MSDVPVSKQYRSIVSELYKDHLENRITEQELSQRLDEAIEEEAKKQEHLGPSLVRQALENIEKNISEDQKKAFEEKAQQDKIARNQQRQRELNEQNERLKKERNEQRYKELKEREEQIAQESEKEAKEQERLSFRKVTGKNITERDESAMRLQRQYNIFQIILLVFSTVTATMAAIDGVARWLVAITGAIASIAGGWLTLFKIQDRIYANRKAVAELRLECQKYDYHIDEYKGISAEEAFIKFSRAINMIQGEQMLQEVELWNPRRDENKKSLPDASADKQEEKEPEKIQDAEISEERGSEDLLMECGESDGEQLKVVPNPLDKVPL